MMRNFIRITSVVSMWALVGLIWFAPLAELRRVSLPVTQRVSLPVKCAPFYNDGTDKWKDCMGVGLK